eukprot:366070-Chlamydomonas_euryale.AAC.2
MRGTAGLGWYVVVVGQLSHFQYGQPDMPLLQCCNPRRRRTPVCCALAVGWTRQFWHRLRVVSSDRPDRPATCRAPSQWRWVPRPTPTIPGAIDLDLSTSDSTAVPLRRDEHRILQPFTCMSS